MENFYKKRVYIGIFIFIAYAMYVQIDASLKDDVIMKKGVVVKAKILHTSFSRGYNIKFEYYINDMYHINSGNTDKFSFEAGDSMLFKILPTEPEGQFHIIKVFYRPKRN